MAQSPGKQTPIVEEDGTVTLDWMAYFSEVNAATEPGVAVANATGAGDVVAQFNALLASLRGRGIIAT